MQYQSPMLSVPCKATDEVDWAHPLRSYIARTYMEDPNKYTDECNAIQRLRQDMRGAGRDVTGRDLLYRYYGQLQMLDLRFPVDENHIRISFNWYDALSSKPIAQFSLAYEKASVLFNIAATLSAIGAAQNRSDPEGVKRAFHSFQASGGVFTYINDNFLHAPTNDLSRDTVKVLVSLMIAQAQEVFVEKSIGEKKKSSLIAKLASHAHLVYSTSQEGMQELFAKGIVEKTWLLMVQAKQKYFGSLVQYYRAQADEDASKYGHVVARLTLAEGMAKDAAKLAQQFNSLHSSSTSLSNQSSMSAEAGSHLLEITKLHAQLMTEKKNTAVHDNDLIYHDPVPSESSLPAVEKLNATKTVDLLDLYSQSEVERIVGPDIFAKLIPLSVHESASLYSEEKAQLVRTETERIQIADGELANALDYMKLPGGLDKFKKLADGQMDASFNNFTEPPKEAIDLANQVHKIEMEQGAIKELENMLESLKTRSKETLDELEFLLDVEQRECEQMRVKYGDSWTQEPSPNSTYRKDVKQHRETMTQAANSDAHIFKLRQQWSTDLEVLAKGTKNLDDLSRIYAVALTGILEPGQSATIPNLIDADSDTMSSLKENISEIEDCLGNLNKIRRERKETLNDLKQKTHEDDISHSLVFSKNRPQAEKELFAAELEKFKPYQQRLTGLIHHQQALLPELTAYYKALLESKEARTVQNKYDQAEKLRRQVTERLEQARDTYLQVQEGLTRGTQFYADFGDLINKLQENINSFVSKRKKERENLVEIMESTRSERDREKLKEQLNRYDTTSSASAPPLPIEMNIAQMTNQAASMSLGDQYKAFGNPETVGSVGMSNPSIPFSGYTQAPIMSSISPYSSYRPPVNNSMQAPVQAPGGYSHSQATTNTYNPIGVNSSGYAPSPVQVTSLPPNFQPNMQAGLHSLPQHVSGPASGTPYSKYSSPPPIPPNPMRTPNPNPPTTAPPVPHYAYQNSQYEQRPPPPVSTQPPYIGGQAYSPYHQSYGSQPPPPPSNMYGYGTPMMPYNNYAPGRPPTAGPAPQPPHGSSLMD